MGIHEARSSGTQILMFMLLITAAYFIFDAFNGFTIWIPVLSVLIPLLLFMGSDARIPVLLDGDRPLNEETHRRLGIILFIAILFAIPPEFPVEPIERWDADATFSVDGDEYAELGDAWNASVLVNLENPSMEKRAYFVSGQILGASQWSADFSCGDTVCEGILEPDESISLELNFVHENTTHQPTFIDYQVDVVFDTSDSHQEFGRIVPNLEASVGAEWYHVRINEAVLSCLDLHIEESATSNISFPNLSQAWLPFLWLDGQAGLTQTLTSEDTTVCLNGVDQALPSNSRALLQHVVLDNNSFEVGFDVSWPHVVSSSDEGWLIDETHPWGAPFDQGGTLYQENSSSCTGNEFLSTPRRSNSSNWTWDLSIWQSQALPSVEQGERLQLKLTTDNYVHCDQEEVIATKFTVQDGPNLILHANNETIRLWDAPMTATTSQLEFSLYNSEANDVVLRHSSFGDVAWDLSSLPLSLSSGWNNFTLNVPSSVINTYQLNHQDGAILLTFGAYLEAES
jgi:hypothetical protein